MDAVSLSVAGFSVFLAGLLVAMFWGAFDDGTPQRASLTWAVLFPLSGLLAVIGLAPLAAITGVVSVLALGTLAWWFLAPAGDDTDDEAGATVEPDPGPSDDIVVEAPRVDEVQLDPVIDWDEFDRLRSEWEREREPLPELV
jgi:hypothetical protein